MKKKSLSKTLIDAAKDFNFDKITINKLEELGIQEPRLFSAKEIKKIREKLNTSQGVFAALLNVNPSTIQKWEQGTVRPQSATLRLLSIINSKGLQVLRD